MDSRSRPDIEQRAPLRPSAIVAVATASLVFPLIAKPDISWHGHGVRLNLSRRRHYFAAGLDCGQCATLFAGNL
jgi:hypothetical protein